MKIFKKMLVASLVIAMVIGMIPENVGKAASNLKLSKTNITMRVDQTKKIKLSGAKKSVKWSSSNSKVADFTSKNKNSATIVALKKGKTIITAKVGRKKLKCKVTVKASIAANKTNTAQSNVVTPEPVVNVQPNIITSEPVVNVQPNIITSEPVVNVQPANLEHESYNTLKNTLKSYGKILVNTIVDKKSYSADELSYIHIWYDEKADNIAMSIHYYKGNNQFSSFLSQDADVELHITDGVDNVSMKAKTKYSYVYGNITFEGTASSTKSLLTVKSQPFTSLSCTENTTSISNAELEKEGLANTQLSFINLLTMTLLSSADSTLSSYGINVKLKDIGFTGIK